MKLWWLMFFSLPALAAPQGRQTISCVEKKSRNQHTLELKFNPAENSGARLKFTVPGRGEMSGEFTIDKFYSVNELSTGVESVRSFSGVDRLRLYEVFFIIPVNVLGKNVQEFSGWLALQNSSDAFEMECSSRFRRNPGY